MGLGHINSGELGVELDHVEAAVAERLLQGEFTASVAQELDGEGVPEGVRADAHATDARGAASRSHQFPQPMRRQADA